MSQNAVVKAVVSPGVVEVSLLRELECGGGCKSCEGCAVRPTEEILALASDSYGVKQGDWVEVEATETGAIGAALLIYFLPCITLLMGYLVADMLGLSIGFCLLGAALGLVLGFLPARMVDCANRAKQAPEFAIIKMKRV